MLLASGFLEACSTPVWQYALEYWQSGSYRVLVFHRGEFSDDARGVLDYLESSPANVSIETVDMASSPDGSSVPPLEEHTLGELPWLVVLYPQSPPGGPVVWSGPFDRSTVRRLLGSPTREEIAGRLLDGQMAVWVLVTCGDKAKDDAAALLLENELARLERAVAAQAPDVIALDVLVGEGPGQSDSAARSAFSLLHVSREDPAEDALVAMLSESESDLNDLIDEPMAFPVFGRGRVLYALVGAGINRDNILRAGAFLTGPCLCEYKEQNPGMDLLMAVDWDTQVVLEYLPDESPPLVGVTSVLAPEHDAEPEADSTPAVVETARKQEEPPDFLWSVVFVFAGGGVFLAVVTYVLLRRSTAGKTG